MLSIFIARTLSIPSIFYNENPCDCDVTDKCDEYCCCDKDCTDEAISNFSQHFCLQQSIEPMTLITCDNYDQLSKSNKVGTIQINNKTCYSFRRKLTDADKITNYEASEVGLSSFVDYIPQAQIPDDIVLDSSTNDFFQEDINSKPMYFPVGVDSLLCNAMIMVMKDKEYNSKCTFPENKAINEIVGETVYSHLATDDQSKNAGMLTLNISGDSADATLTSDTNLSFEITTVSTDSSGNEALTTTKGGYDFGLNLVGVYQSDNAQNFTYFTFGSKKVGFSTSLTFFADPANAISDEDYFDADLNLSTTYGPLDTEDGTVDILKMPNFTLAAGSSAKSIIYTLMYKKFGYTNMFYYKFIGVDMQILNSSKDFHTIELLQLELSDSGTSEEEPQVDNSMSISLKQIFGFMFQDASDSETTTGIVVIAFIVILIWLDALFVD